MKGRIKEPSWCGKKCLQNSSFMNGTQKPVDSFNFLSPTPCFTVTTGVRRKFGDHFFLKNLLQIEGFRFIWLRCCIIQAIIMGIRGGFFGRNSLFF